MVDDLEDPEDERAIELSTIAAIYPELVIDPSDRYSASIDLPIEPGKPIAVLFPLLAGGATPPVNFPTPPTSDGSSHASSGYRKDVEDVVVTGKPVLDIHHLSYLPALTLRINLPKGYPRQNPPNFQLHTNPPWLPDTKLREIKNAGVVMWDEMGRDQVVFSYMDYLQQAAEDGFSLVKGNGGALEVPQDLKIGLLDFELKAKRAKFEQETFECGVCLEPKKGSVCHRLLLCSHVFCVTCLQDFYNACIIEGDVTNVKCLAPDCGKDSQTSGKQQRKKRRRKEDRTLDPSELLQIPLEQETVQRYVKLKRKKMLESDRTTVYCPRQWCQGPARSKKTEIASEADESASEDETPETQSYDPNANQDTLPPPSERLAICEDCAFAFCKVCKSGWHGEFARCFPRKKYELTAEEKASEEYMKIHTTPCPTCDARAQKTEGCNHMICFKCGTHFCYLCSTWLDDSNPYLHYNTKNAPCYQRLWELEAGDGADVGNNYGGGVAVGGAQPPIVVGMEGIDSEDEADDVRQAPPAAPAPPPPAPRVRPNDRRQPPAPALAPPPAPRLRPNDRRQPPARANQQQVPANRRGLGGRINLRVQQGLARPGPMPQFLIERGPPVQGLQRFLQMVENDEEDEWDSDELDEEGEDDDRWEIPVR